MILLSGSRINANIVLKMGVFLLIGMVSMVGEEGGRGVGRLSENTSKIPPTIDVKYDISSSSRINANIVFKNCFLLIGMHGQHSW